MGEKPGMAAFRKTPPQGAELFFSQYAEPFIALNTDLKVSEINETAGKLFRLHSQDIGKPINQLFRIEPQNLEKLRSGASAWIELLFPETGPCPCLWVPLPGPETNRSMGVLLFAGCNQLRSEAERQLEEVRKSQDDFIYSISHDLRAPLRAIQGFSQLLAHELEGAKSETATTYLQRMTSAADRMEAYMNDLLILSRIARTSVLLRPIKLEPVLEAAKGELAGLIKKTSGSIHVEGTLPEVVGMNTLCQYAFHQLLHNALTYVPAGTPPQIVISAKSEPEPMIEVADNGIGINPEHFRKIFKPFERLHSGESHPGTGLGLAIVEQAMAKMGGTVSVDSAVGTGSKFTLHFQPIKNLVMP